MPNFKPELWTRPSSLNIRPRNIEIFTCNQQNCNFRFDLGFHGLLRHLCSTWNMASEDDHLHLSCESSDFEEDETLQEVYTY